MAPAKDGRGSAHPAEFGATRPGFSGSPGAAPAPFVQPTGAGTPEVGAVARVPGANFQRTMLGVAHPGIAPLRTGPSAAPEPNPAQPENFSPERTAAAVVPAFFAPAPSAAVVETERVASPPPAVRAPPRVESRNAAKRRTGLPRGVVVLMVVAGVLAITAGVIAFLWQSPHPIAATVVSDDHGVERLLVTCDDCPDGTAVSLGKSAAKFDKKKAMLALAKSLDVGSNALAIDVRRPGIGRDEEVKLTVVIGYSVRGDLSALAEDPPKAKVLIDAVAGTAVVVDGHPITLDASGKGNYSIDVSHDVDGPADTVVPFERQIPYTLTEAGKPPHQGQVILKFGIAPLRIEAPGAAIVIQGETFMLSGRTLKDGRITVAGRPITVDAEGRFAQLMNVSSVGQTTIVVRADAKDHGPRLASVNVKRVASLVQEAVSFRMNALDNAASIADADAKKGAAVALDGDVVETRVDGQITVIVLDVKKGCANTPCLVRIAYGARFETKRGAAVSAFGHVTGAVDGPRTGTKIPAVEADFVLPKQGR
jgi:hypothetical protein